MGNKSRTRSAARKLSRERDKEFQRRQNILEVQETEMELLRNMYLDDFELLEDDADYDFPRAFSVKIHARNEAAIHLILQLKLPREYPHETPKFALTSVKGLNVDDQKNLFSALQDITESKLGEVCVYELVTCCADYLDEHGSPIPESFHAEMTILKAQREELEFQRQSKQRDELASVEHSTFQKRVEEELSKKAARIVNSKSVPGVVTNKSTIRSPSQSRSVHDIFPMEDLEFVHDSDYKEDDSRSNSRFLSCGSDSEEKTTDTTEVTDTTSARESDNTDDEMIALSFNEALGTPLQRFLESRAQKSATAPTPLRLPPSGKDAGLYPIKPGARKSSRYLENFSELGVLGQGGFGSVVKARNILDGIVFGIKKVPLPIGNLKARARILREVTTIARLHHRYIVRYYQSWIERSSNQQKRSHDVLITTTPHTTHDSVHDWMSGAIHSPGSDLLSDEASSDEQETLFIQFEYCPNKTLRAVIDEGGLTESSVWRILRQLCEALHYIHQQGVVHRDIKPPNVFFDESGDIKIGDFGLAISRNTELSQDGSSGDGLKNGTHSDCVGTPYYRSPEAEAGGEISDKTDMYALGITLFEMFTHFTTAMERHVALTALRMTGTVDDGAELKCKRFGNEFRSIVHMLLSRDPKKRPSAEILLRKALIPLAEDEAQFQSALDSLSVPNSTFRSRVVETLFRITPDRAVDVTFDMDPVSTSNQSIFPSALSHASMKIVSRIEDIFKRHTAVRYSTPILTPKLTAIKESNPIVMMDSFGVLVQLPHSLTVPFARMVALRGVSSMRRFDISRVYRQAVGGGQPIQLLVSTFDMIYPSTTSRRFHTYYTCELLRILDDVVSILIGTHARSTIYINDLRILESILDQFVPASKFPHARVAIESHFGRICYTPWQQIRRSLIQDYELPEEIATILDIYASLRGSPDLTLPKFEATLNNHGLGSIPTVRSSLESLQAIFRLLEQIHITQKIRFHACVVADWQLYQGGIAFQVVHDASGVAKSIAIGGRYDELISKFRPPTAKNPLQSALGISIVLESLLPAQSQEPVSYSSVLLFCNLNKMLEERFRVACLLWSNGFQAEYDVDPSVSLAALPRYCRMRGIRFLVVFRASQYGAGMVKVFDITRHHQHGDRHAQGYPVELNNLVSSLQSSARKVSATQSDRDTSTDGIISSNANSSVVSSGLSAALSDRNNVEVIDDPDSSMPLRGHIRNQHIRTATTLAIPFVTSCDSSQYRIVVLALPISAIRPCTSAFYAGNLDMMKQQCSNSRHVYRAYLLALCDWLQQQLERNRLLLRYVILYSTEDKKIDLLQL